MIEPQDIRALMRDKYDGDMGADMHDDLARLARGEPLAYVIGWVPFLGLHIDLGSKPLIPRPETEQWAEELIARLHQKFGGAAFAFLDLCAGSGAVGLAVLHTFQNVRVTFAELDDGHAKSITESISANALAASRAEVVGGDLFEKISVKRFDIIAANPPYIPQERILPKSVMDFEPPLALFSGTYGLDLIERIAKLAPTHLEKDGELWLECDESNIASAKQMLHASGFAEVSLHTDQYGRERFLVGYL